MYAVWSIQWNIKYCNLEELKAQMVGFSSLKNIVLFPIKTYPIAIIYSSVIWSSGSFPEIENVLEILKLGKNRKNIFDFPSRNQSEFLISSLAGITADP